MGVWGRIKDWAIRRAYARYRRVLTKTSASQVAEEADRQLIQAFQHAARTVPAYRELLRQCGVEASAITSASAFRDRVPVLSKQRVFTDRPDRSLRELCTGGTLNDVALVFTSSGHSGHFSFGVEQRGQEADAALAIEFLLDVQFGVLDRRSLLVNCLPMGVRVPTRTLTTAEAGTRVDAVLELIRKLAPEFDQVILVGEHLFLKHVADTGTDAGIAWADHNVHVIVGGEFIPETFRSYLAGVLGIDPTDPAGGRIVLNMGLSELSISIFRDAPELAAIRRAALADADLREALCGGASAVCPEILQYDPRTTYVEIVPGEDGHGELAISTIERNRKLPLLRYRTGDRGRTMTHPEFATLVQAHGCGHLVPPWPLPVAVIWGRQREVELPSGTRLGDLTVKEALYASNDLARQLTGRFRVSAGDDTAQVAVQLRPSVSADTFRAAPLAEAIAERSPCPVEVRPFEHDDYPYGRMYDFQTKTRYVAQPADA